MPVFTVEVTFRCDITAPDPGIATKEVEGQVEFLKGAAEQLKWRGYKKPVVEVKSWEKGG